MPTQRSPLVNHPAKFWNPTWPRGTLQFDGDVVIDLHTRSAGVLLNELLHSRRTPPLRVLRTVVSGAVLRVVGGDGTGDERCLGVPAGMVGS
jgi:hypothetical protein